MKQLLFLALLLTAFACNKKDDPEPDGQTLIGEFVIPDNDGVRFILSSQDSFPTVIIHHKGQVFEFYGTKKEPGLEQIKVFGIYGVAIKTYGKGKDTYVSYKLSEKGDVTFSYVGILKRVK